MGPKLHKKSFDLGVVGAFSEVINAGVKQLALSAPLPPDEMDNFIEDAKKIAAKHNVLVYRESDLIVTDLFPADIAKGLDVLLLFQGTTKDNYLMLKEDQKLLKDTAQYNEKNRRMISKRFGRMLSYSPQKINGLLSMNTPFKTMINFGLKANNLFLYYDDLKKAGEFYVKNLGFELMADYKMAQIMRMTKDSYLILVDGAKGMHTTEEPKTVALALLTDQLKEWYEHLKSKNVKIKDDFKEKENSAHDGFIVVDPEGYLLEFERFNQHQENERFFPLLNQNKEVVVQSAHESDVPAELSIHSTIIWLYYKDVLAMQHFYEDVYGFEEVVDQGWTKIYRVSETGFMAIVDEKRGMHKFTDQKAVNVGFILDDIEGWFKYVKKNSLFDLKDHELHIEKESRYKAFVGYGPEKYFIEFDKFFPHQDNTRLLKYLME
ncbi:hypothetical protein NEF87_001200 [Candidatus Lokiarchaeum ossiferum]|uniref:VOC domain-containing protein n=1 Tax=Candidatus Lokiarchaeum ossiferum TaxID=2951803 RepID=A0ABY6HNE3_9ARCH|nr:hypothetical protein NEF87_001200 [Candidatus Lokiarchaeum sp. B-35]